MRSGKMKAILFVLPKNNSREGKFHAQAWSGSALCSINRRSMRWAGTEYAGGSEYFYSFYSFTISVDKLEGCTTGVSASDRAATFKALADRHQRPKRSDDRDIYSRCGPDQSVLRRAGHTEAAADLARLVGLPIRQAPSFEIMNEDGSMARLFQLLNLLTVQNEDYYYSRPDSLSYPNRITHRKRRRSGYANSLRTLQINTVPSGIQRAGTRCHSSRVTGKRTNLCWLEYIHPAWREIFLDPCVANAANSRNKAMQLIEKEGKGAIVYMNQGRSWHWTDE